MIAKLRADHQHHVDALSTIQSVFNELAISPDGENAETFVLGLLNGKTLTTAQVNEAWKKAGRGGIANNALTNLAKQKKMRRSAVKGERGSKYSFA